MNILQLRLHDFRNYSEASYTFDPANIHVLYGRNAQGKTNILEAIYFMSHLRSFRTLKTKALIRHNQPVAVLETVLETKGRQEELKITLNEAKKNLYRFGSPVATFSSFVGIVNAILFCPDDLALFSRQPKDRRQFIDMELVKLSRKYTTTLSHYQKILKERNAALKAWPVNKILVDTYTAQMIEDQQILIEQRARFIQELEEKAALLLPDFSQEAEHLKIHYRTFVDPTQDLPDQLKEKYASSRNRDLQMKTTSWGIHKDDIEFELNGKILTQTASQGQKRSVLLAVKIALCQMIFEKTGQYPILLLDDVFSELDQVRRQALIRLLPSEMQIFITTAERLDPAWFDRPARFYTVENGIMKEGIYDV